MAFIAISNYLTYFFLPSLRSVAQECVLCEDISSAQRCGLHCKHSLIPGEKVLQE